MVATTAAIAELGALLVPAPPQPGFTAITDGTFGPFDLERFLRDFSTDTGNERTILSTAGFVRGDSRGWVDNADSPTALAVFVFEFRDAVAASSARDKVLALSGNGSQPSPFAVPAVRGAVGMSSFVTTDSGRERVHGIAFVRGARVFVVAAQHASLRAPTGVALELAKAQATLVP